LILVKTPSIMKNPFTFLLATLFILPLLAQAAEGPARQDLAALRTVAQQFLRTQASGLPGTVEAEVDALDPRLNLSPCTAPQAFLPNGSRAWGKTTVGLRCSAPAPWTVYVAARVRIMAEYVATAAPLAQGQLIGADDIAMLKGDLSTLPAGILTDSSQAIGRTVTRSLPLGTPLREDSIRRPQAIRMGQTVQLVSVGPGFRISGEGRAISNANEGQTAQARTPTGQIVSGIAAAGGVLEVRY
jgi:flagella basal body P-ring formation protein FlgA